MSEPSIVHCCTHLRPLGGVQSILRRHLRQDSRLGWSSSSVIFFENEPFLEAPAGRQVTGLGMRWHHLGRTLRRRFERRRAAFPASATWVYHDLWGLPTLADLDSSVRRLGVLHSHWVGADDLLRFCQPLLDGILCVSAATVELARHCLPQLPAERIRWLPYPVDSPDPSPIRTDAPRTELVVGYCGRIQRPQKRVERLPEIARVLRDAGVGHRWEFLGQGPEQPVLEREFGRLGVKAVFHGVQTGEAYWRCLARWDAIVFVSDYEGLPIALLEALSQGVVPVVPDIDNGGRDYTAKVAPELVYPATNLSAAAAVLRGLAEQTPETRDALRTRARDTAAPHGQDAYGRTFSEMVKALLDQPRISTAGAAARRPHPGEWFPYGFLGKLPPAHRLRRGYL